MEEYLIRFSQTHESFRLPELQSLALLEGLDMTVVSYSDSVGFQKSNIFFLPRIVQCPSSPA